tara:strand:+ start:84 stop:485 length:402 start_codon:yes stop_codon:yes gene_type:complete
MDNTIKEILKAVDIDPDCLDGALIPRDMLINDFLYEKIQEKIPDLKKKFSSSYMTSLHKGAKDQQKWPLLNLIRQVLHTYHYQMKPIRKSDGYTPQGVKKYKRFFLISKISALTMNQSESEPKTEKELTQALE